MFRNLLGPKNSLILAYDHLTPEAAEVLDEQITEVGQYYKFTKLSELAARKTYGLAAVVFLNPRKSFQLRGLSSLAGRDIPATLFIQPDCVGMNRLPPDEELRLFQDAYPGAPARLPDGDADTVDRFLQGLRQSLGPLPVDKLDPTLFFTTWGKLLEIPPELREFGLHLGSSGIHPGDLSYLSTQVKEKVTVAYSPIVPEADLRREGITAVLTPETGLVDKRTLDWRLPTYKFDAGGVT